MTEAKPQVDFRGFLLKSLRYHARQKREDFDPHGMSPREIDALLEERKAWQLLKKHADENEEEVKKITPVISYLNERLETINSILKRLAN